MTGLSTDRGGKPGRPDNSPSKPRRRMSRLAAPTVRELSFSSIDDRERLNRALQKRAASDILVLEVPRDVSQDFRVLIRRLIDLTSRQGVEEITREIDHLGKTGPSSTLRAPEPSVRKQQGQRADPDPSPNRAWATLRHDFFQRFETATTRELADLTGSRAKNVAARSYDWTKAGRIFGINDGSEVRYPLFQIREGKPISQMVSILSSLRSRGFSDWEVAIWFATPNAHLDDWSMPADVLAKYPDKVIRAAEVEAQEVVY